MSYYVIGVGGTGAKCVEAFTHLVAAGSLGDSESKSNVRVVLVDPDTANGSLERTRNTLQYYRQARSAPTAGKIPFLRDDLEPADQQRSSWVWTPFADESQPSFQRRFAYEGMGPLEAGLLDVLYTEEEKTASLKKGFLGRPSIGAAVMADSLDLKSQDLEEPWRGLCSQLDIDNEPKVFVVGSIFGGTGASGVPTISRLLADYLRKKPFRLGCALVMPYFSFPAPDKDKAMQLQAYADEFLLRSQAALGYYQDKINQTNDTVYNSVYLLGTADQPQVANNSLGSKEQRNPPHYLELYAATGMLHFFAQPLKDPTRTYMLRSPGPELRWDALPGGKPLELRLAHLARFSYAFLGHFYKRLQNPVELERQKVAWFIRFFRMEGVQQAQLALNWVRDYCETYLAWLHDIQQFSGGTQVSLFNTATYQVSGTRDGTSSINIPIDQFSRIYAVEDNLKNMPRNFSDLSAMLAQRTPDASVGATDVGRFIHALYKVCSPTKEN